MSPPLDLRNDASPSASASKKPASTLLPAFEPFSSPALPRPLKRGRDNYEDHTKYPTPIATSSTHILTSSPSRAHAGRPPVGRTVSTLSERAPLASLPSIELHNNGHPVRFGRSSASCDYQLSSNRLISRVHVVATYKPTVSSLDRERIDIQCTGWNGVKVHCQSKVFEVKKGETFTSDMRDFEIMLDVHGTRVIVNWPEKPHFGPVSSDEEDLPSPSKKQRAMLRHSTPPSPSPIHTRRKPMSPISPSPALASHLPSSPPLIATRQEARAVEIYEDPVPAEGEVDAAAQEDPSQPTQIMSQNLASFKSLVSTEPVDDFADDNDEENDPLIHSFGPFGSNLQARMASITASETLVATISKSSPTHHSPVARSPAKIANSSPTHLNHVARSPTKLKPTSSGAAKFDVKTHVINQLAFSRLSSTPLSTILGNLPTEAGSLEKADLHTIIAETDCIGEVTREGKDAHGKKLESEYYYVPDNDTDEFRREAVVTDLRKPGLRACRKQHKVSAALARQPAVDNTDVS